MALYDQAQCVQTLIMNTARFISIFHIMYYHLILQDPFEKTQLTVHKNMGCTLLNDYHHLTWSPFDLFFQEICTFLLYTYLSRHILIMMKPYLDAKFPGKPLRHVFHDLMLWVMDGLWEMMTGIRKKDHLLLDRCLL